MPGKKSIIIIIIIIINNNNNNNNTAVAQLVEALRYKPAGRGFDSRWCQWIFFIGIILSVALWPWGRPSL
jgi:hypothetical protein